MSLAAILAFAFVVGFGFLLVWDAWRLIHLPQPLDRITEAHATAYSRLAEYGFWTLRHLLAAITGAELRRQRLMKVLLCAALFGLVLTPIVLAAQAANLREVATHPVAFAIGTAVWSVVVESPSLPYRIERYAPDSRLVPPIAAAAIVIFFDVTICAITLANVAYDEAEAFATGAAFVAVGDLVSAAVGLTMAAIPEYPLKDPVPPQISEDDDGNRPRTPPEDPIEVEPAAEKPSPWQRDGKRPVGASEFLRRRLRARRERTRD
jgi:hypothetical protein